ncbi:CTQ-dependent lysine 6-oxidase LodA [Microcoleus sp. ARI1-B5]|uniref:CTQ-dependent lysine 6-oxidase LodA n=1 Tax=unclassified Microcoleus TaxID=2642155 RepID=UPI002FD1E96A
MSYTYSIYPSVGVVRVGNSDTDFFLAPEQIGGLPIECDSNGNGLQEPFSSFKDAAGKVKRQAQKFRIYRKNPNFPDRSGEEVTLENSDVESIVWTVHLANKKAAWYKFSEYKGNLLFGEKNSYQAQGVDLRNKETQDRQSLIIDPGPRTISGTHASIEISRDNIPSDYKHGHFPPPSPKYGYPINKLGDLKTDSAGRLLVLGGFGKSGGDLPLSSYGGADTWYDDISDGSVTCTITVKNEEPFTLKAWVVVGPPHFAPEITNISTWDDTMFDVGVRYFNLVPELYKNGAWSEHFQANYQRDILPIIQRISGYHWVANVQSMIAFSSNIFDFSDPSEANKANRKRYFSYFRQPEPPNPSTFPQSRQYTLFSNDNVPMMPLNSGSNSVSNDNIEKFLALTQTQYFLLKQWADGKFKNYPDSEPFPGVDEKNSASVGNVVGLPQCPGIEVTWTTQNPALYEDSYIIASKDVDYQNGLTPGRDECEGGGCEPGDLTKRMAIPWQADFFNCSIQLINFTDPNTNKTGSPMVPKPPTYYSYWWPPQAPWDVLGGDETEEAQAASGIPAGLQVNFIRGVNSYKQMVNQGWSYLAFIRNKNTGSNGQMFPYLVETERNNEMFDYQSVPISQITTRPDDDGTDVQVFYLKSLSDQRAVRSSRLRSLNLAVEEEMFNEIEVVEEERQRIPRAGTRVRF